MSDNQIRDSSLVRRNGRPKTMPMMQSDSTTNGVDSDD